MTKLLQQGLEAILKLPEDRQDDAGELLLAMAEGESVHYRLSSEQVEELKLAIAEATGANSRAMRTWLHCGRNAGYEASLHDPSTAAY
jgi:hypothetical protein